MTARKRAVIQLNAASVRSLEVLEREYAKLADEGWFVKGTSARCVMYHELGHVFSHANKISGMRIARAIIGSKDLAKVVSGMSKKLSRYASSYENGREIVSEVFSAWFGKTGNEFAEEAMRRIASALGR